MRRFSGYIETDLVGSRVEFEFEVEDDATDDEIEGEGKQVAFEHVSWSYQEIK